MDHIIPRAHHRIWTFLEKLKAEQRNTEADFERAEFGEPPRKKRRSFTLRTDRLRGIIQNAGGVYDVNYLRAIAHNFAF